MTDLGGLAATRLARLDRRARGALFRAAEAAEAAVALFHRHRPGGRPIPHPIALTPFVVSRRLLPTLERLADCVHRFQTRAPELYRAAAFDFRALCPVGETTARWLARDAGASDPRALMIRPDVGLDVAATGPPRAVLFETNATGLAGLYNHAAGVAILRREVFPRLYTVAEQRRLADPPDLLALVYRWVGRAARRLGRRRLRGVAFIEEAAPLAGYSEVPRLARAFEARGVRAARGTPGELRRTRSGVFLHDCPVDLVYRDLAYEDLGPPSVGDRGAGAVAALAAAGAVLPSLAGEFAHKGLLEALLRPEYRRLFTPGERRLLRAAVPWTRVLTARFTEAPDGRRVDLPEYARHHHGWLLIKPNVGSGGEGILLGRETPAARWERRIARALREPGAWVVQERRPGTRRPMVYLRDGAAYAGPCFSSLGLFYAPSDLGLHVRVSRAPIVNVARGGALACAFLTS